MVLAGFCIVGATIVGVWFLLLHFQANVLEPFILDVVNQAMKAQEIGWDRYHEDKLLPAMTLLASQRINVAPPLPPPEVNDDPPRTARLPRELDDKMEIEQIYDRLKRSY